MRSLSVDNVGTYQVSDAAKPDFDEKLTLLEGIS